MNKHNNILAKKEGDYNTTLSQHLKDVADVAIVVSKQIGLNEDIAFKGAILHDIGKASNLFQQTLKQGFVRPPNFIFRHEIASLFFLSLVEEHEKDRVIDMIVAHHKSIYKDPKKLGLLDLDDIVDSFTIHSNGFDEWSKIAIDILADFGFAKKAISIKEAKDNYEYAIDYCNSLKSNCSQWKGLLMASDHLASALNYKTTNNLDKLFIKPDLTFFCREHDLYPLSKISTNDNRKHTLVTAPTGAGKTDFLMRRCVGRVFYTLPYQASINAMYDRFIDNLKDTNAQIHLQHATSSLKVKGAKIEERIMQRHIGSSIKVLTPHQISSIVFGIKGYEAMVLDLKGCDIILDEIHTYSDVIQAIVLRVIEILVKIDCRVHIGTATMPTVLHNKVLEILGGSKNVYEVSLTDDVLETFNRHITYKVENFEQCINAFNTAINEDNKILIVCNQISRSQDMYIMLKEQYPDIDIMLIHSRFKRKHRQELENKLKQEYNTASKACIVVSTQVVEVSLDISFDIMITECAPIDAMIQRFGRINRKRTNDTIGKYKPIYIIAPPQDDKEALPYSMPTLQKSYDALNNGELFNEVDIQHILDKVYSDIGFLNIDYSAVAFKEGKWILKELWHRPKSALLETLNIDSATCIIEDDKTEYKNIQNKEYIELEIPVSYKSIGYKNLEQIEDNSRPFVIPNKAYSDELGFLTEFAKPEYYKTFEIL